MDAERAQDPGQSPDEFTGLEATGDAGSMEPPLQVGDDVLHVIADVEARLTSLRKFHAEREQTKDRLKEREAQFIVRERELAERLESLRSQASDIEQRRSALAEAETRAEARREGLERSADEVRLRESGLEARSLELDARGRELDEKMSRLRDAAGALGAEREELRRSREEASRAGERSAELEGQLGALTRRFGDIQDELAERGAVLEHMRGRLEAAQGAAEERDAAVATLGLELHARRSESADSGAGAGVKSKTGGRADADGLGALRRERLRRVRGLLRAQSLKIRQASEMLRTRYEQCEQVLSHRVELIAARHSIVEAQRRVQARAARTRSAAVVFYAVATLGVLGALSWALARQVAPATFIARAEIAADGRGRELAQGELEEWQRFHELLLTDPRLVELGAERMARRGIASLAKPGDLLARLEADLHTESAVPGALVIELRGQGAESTERALDTYVTALVSQANAARERRSDGAATFISEPAKSGQEPVEDQRVLYGAGMLGGGTLISLLAAGVFWRRLAEAKSMFERDEAMGNLMDGTRWPEPASLRAEKQER